MYRVRMCVCVCVSCAQYYIAIKSIPTRRQKYSLSRDYSSTHGAVI